MRRIFLAVAIPLILVACGPDETVTSRPVASDAATQVSYAANGWVAKTLPELVLALQAGEVTSATLVEAYLARIDAIDRDGPTLRSVLALNPDALTQARALDARRGAGEDVGPLAGAPVLLKDNIESADPVATTAGALVLKDNVTGRDAPLAAGLRAHGAIILGKANLSQWANFRSRDSISGWSALGGQVRNPHMLDRSPCGSSSGSGAAVAASLAAAAVGTETNGSIICPANVNGIVGFKPTVGLVSQRYIVPISPSQDTAGPMTKTVRGAAMLMNAMASGASPTDYVAALDAASLTGRRVGVLRFSVGANADIVERFDAALQVLREAGAELVEIESFDHGVEGYRDHASNVLHYEFKASLNAYLADAANAVVARTLEDVIAFNQDHADIELALFDQSIMLASQAKRGLDDDDYRASRDAVLIATREKGIDALLATYNVEVLVAPSGPVASRVDPINGDVWPNWVGAGHLAAVAGYPHVSVPMGTVHGVPIGLSFMGPKNADAAILSFGYAYEQASRERVAPRYLRDGEARPEIAKAMSGTH